MEKARVLVVDDSEAGRYALAHCLRQSGHEVIEAGTGKECLQLAASGKADLILLDVKLPDISGIDVCHQLKADPKTALVPVIQISALLTSTANRIQGLESGADAYLAAPFEPRELLAHVQGLLRLRRAEERLRQDILHRQRLERSEERLLALVNHNPCLIFLKDQEGRYVYLNESYRRQFVPSRDWHGKTDFDFWPEVSAELFRANDAEVLASGQTQQFLEHSTDRAGKRFCWLCYKFPFTDSGGARYVGGVGIDATDRVVAEEALRRSEERFRIITDTTPVIMWMTNANGEIEFVNRAYREFFGVTLEQVTGPGNWQPLVHPEDAVRYFGAFHQALHDRVAFNAEARVRRADGQWRWVQSYGAPRFDEQGVFLGMAGSSPDVTETKDFQAELERVVAERTAKLEELVGELEHFSYTITHDMRAPLRAMRGFAEIAGLMCADCGRNGPREFLTKLSASADRMDALIRDALNYSRAVRHELPLEEVDTGALLRGMLDTYPDLQPLRATVRVQGHLPVVLGNEAGLTQCFSNLLDNAVKFVRPGQTPDIRVWAEEQEGWVRMQLRIMALGSPSRCFPGCSKCFRAGTICIRAPESAWHWCAR